MKKITIFFNIINYVICDTMFISEMCIKRLVPLYWIYKISVKFKIAKIERLLYKYYWWYDTNSREKKHKRNVSIFFFTKHNSDKIFAILFLTPAILCLASIISNISKQDFRTIGLLLAVFSIILLGNVFDDKKVNRYVKIFNRIRYKYIAKWRIMAIITLISGIILANYINRIMLFILKIL